jgi:GT2 family glycosyltransferase
MSMSEELVAVVVTYNRLEKLKVALNALLTQRCDAIVVVDNCSTDGSRDWLVSKAREHAKLDTILLSENTGGAGGFEAGFRHALATYQPDWLVGFDDDAYPAPSALNTFMASDLEGIDAAAAAVYFPNGEICEMNRPAINPFWHWRLFFRTVLGKGRQGFHLSDESYKSKKPVAIDTTSFVGFFVRRQTIERIGFPEGRLFIYGDDVLYSLTIRRANGRIFFMPWVHFIHDCAALSTHEKTIKPLWKVYYAYRNSLRVYHAASGWLFWLFLPWKISRWLLKTRTYERRSSYLKLLFIALKDAAFQHYRRPHNEIVALAGETKRPTDSK